MKLFLSILLSVLLGACSSQYANQQVVNQPFPNSEGETLTGELKQLPQMFAGQKTLLLVGYVQDSQFDIDRWLIGLDMKKTNLPVYEIPTIAGLFPRMFETQINEGMRRGIPKELWKGVITIYKDGDMIQAFTGNENPNNARVILLDESGNIIYFYDRGFSVAALNEVLAI